MAKAMRDRPLLVRAELHRAQVTTHWSPVPQSSTPLRSTDVAFTAWPTLGALRSVLATTFPNADAVGRKSLYIYVEATMPLTGSEGVNIPIESDHAWCHFRKSPRLTLVLRSELTANVFPSRFFTVSDLVRYTQSAPVRSWHPPRIDVPTLIHRDVDAIRRKQFAGAIIKLIVPRTVLLEPGAMEEAQGAVIIGSRTGIHASQFHNHRLSSISVSEGTEIIHRDAFVLSMLKNVRIPSSIRHIGASAFRQTSITHLDIRHARSLVVIEQRAFQACVNLVEVHLPIVVQHIGSSAFDACTSLVSVNIHNSAPMRVVESGCYQHTAQLVHAPLTDELVSIQHNGFFASGIVHLDLSCTQMRCIGDRAFGLCTRLKTFRGSASLMALGSQVFAGCTALESVDIGKANGLTFTPIGCFDGCKKLKHVDLPHGLRSIRGVTFRNCRKLRILLLPATVGSVGEQALAGTTSLRSIIVNASRLPEFHPTSLKHSAAIVVSRRADPQEVSHAVVEVPSRLAWQSEKFQSLLLGVRLSNAHHHRDALRRHVAARVGVTNAETARHRRHRKFFATMPELPLELWLHVLKFNSPWPSRLPCSTYFPRLLYKPSFSVWKTWLGRTGAAGGGVHIPPLLTFLFETCTRNDVKTIARHACCPEAVVATKNRPLATLIYTQTAGPFPHSATTFDHDKQVSAVEALKQLLAATKATKRATGWLATLLL
tara:strand:- start:4440 stop:6575 length:2136 start_codon:yes stop_codon:yes gene_type:complete